MTRLSLPSGWGVTDTTDRATFQRVARIQRLPWKWELGISSLMSLVCFLHCNPSIFSALSPSQIQQTFPGWHRNESGNSSVATICSGWINTKFLLVSDKLTPLLHCNKQLAWENWNNWIAVTWKQDSKHSPPTPFLTGRRTYTHKFQAPFSFQLPPVPSKATSSHLFSDLFQYLQQENWTETQVLETDIPFSMCRLHRSCFSIFPFT